MKSSVNIYSERTSVKAINMNYVKGNYIEVKLDDESHHMPEEVAMELLEKLAEAMGINLSEKMKEAV